MDNGKFTERSSLKNVLDGFIDSYAKWDKGIEFSDWLAGKLRQEIPNMSEESSKRLAGEIIGAVSDYDKTLGELNDAIDSGQSKEEWLAERLAETYADMPVDDAGEKLRQIEDSLTASNTQLMREIDGTQLENGTPVDTGNVEWNEYSIKDKVYKIGKQIVLSGMAVVANVMKDKVYRDEAADIGSIVRETLPDGLKKDSGEVKAVVAGAIKAAAENGLTDIPDENICDMAGVAVEGAEALYDAACGECTMTEALDKIGRASIAAGCRYCARALKGVLSSVPPVGPLLVKLFGNLLDHMETPKFAENAYTTVRNVAVSAWKGIKGTVSKGINFVKSRLLN